MTWTDPKTWAAGATLTAAELNEQLRDNLTALKTLADLAVFSGCEPYRTTNLSLATATPTNITYPLEGWDYGGWFTPGSTDIIVPVTAIPTGYSAIMVGLQVRARFASNATGYRRVRFAVNGGAVGTVTVDANSGSETEVQVVDYTKVVAGDVITVEATQTSGGNLNLEVTTAHCVRIGAVV
jgi:hypothetical protein